MASSGKRKTTMAKLNRESRLRERRAEKQARKEARKLAPPDALDGLGDADGVSDADGLGDTVSGESASLVDVPT
jgi:hypothetical protein